MTRARTQGGFTAIEVLLASTLFLVVMFATLTMLDAFGSQHRKAEALMDSVDRARTAMDRLTQDLRNATGYGTTGAPGGPVVTRATATDLVIRKVRPFGTSTPADPHAIETVRWCLDTATRRLHRLSAAGVATPPAACPGSGWADRVVAVDVVNGSRPLFRYNADDAADITSVGSFLAVDPDARTPPAETALSSGVHLRNQNLRPTARFTAVSTGGRNVQLNGSSSSDPEGAALTYTWQDGTTTLAATGPIASFVAPASGPRTITLTVRDPGGMSHAVSEVVVVQP